MEILIYFISIIICIIMWGFIIYISEEFTITDMLLFIISLFTPIIFIICILIGFILANIIIYIKQKHPNFYNNLKIKLNTPLWKKK